MLKRRLFPVILSSVASLIGLALPTMGRSETANVGILIGPSFGKSTTNFTFGAEAQAELMAPWGGGVSFSYFSKSNTVAGYGNTNYGTGFLTLTLQGLYFFPDALEGLRAGLQAGLGITSTDVPGASGDTALIFGPTGGYDYKFSPNFSIGGEGTLYFSSQGGSSPIFQLLAAVKYWF